MSIRKSKVNQKFYEIQGEFVFEGQRIRYHKSFLKDKNFMSKKWCEEEEVTFEEYKKWVEEVQDGKDE